jgi:transposase-like protein
MSVMPRSGPLYPPEFRREAVQLVLGVASQVPGEFTEA